MAVKNMWNPEELEELRIILQDIEDMGYRCYLRQIGQIIIYKNGGGEIEYNEEFYNALCESVDRIQDLPYKLHKIYYELKLRAGDNKFFGRDLKKYDYPIEPENFDIKWIPGKDSLQNFIEVDLSPNKNPEKALITIEIHLVPKKILKRIKSFINYVD